MPTFDVIPKQEAQLKAVNGRRGQTQGRTNGVDMATTQQFMDVADLCGKDKDELLVVAHAAGLADGAAINGLRREDLLNRIFQVASAQQALVASGILETMDEGYGFLRQITLRSPMGDVYISQSQIRRFGLRSGDTVTGQVRPPKEGERYFGLVRVEKVNGLEANQIYARFRPQFEYLTPIFPEKHVVLETDSSILATRMVDPVRAYRPGAAGPDSFSSQSGQDHYPQADRP